MDSVVISVSDGQLRGNQRKNLDGKNFYSFLGIPYGKPPTGELRFKAPEPAEPWSGIRDATKDGNSCFQRNEFDQTIEGSEDCLNLSIYTRTLPSQESILKPVMVWIHGGGFCFGSNKHNVYGPEHLMLEDIVLVCINFRLGFLGYLHLNDSSLDVPGNAGLKDQVLALKWIQENIKNFNGDPKNVTIFGESAGSASVHYLVLSSAAEGLFHKAILQSGCVFSPWSRSEDVAIQFAQIADKSVNTEAEALEVLRSLSVENLFAHQEEYIKKYGRRRKIAPNIEKPNKTAILTTSPQELIVSGQYNKVPLIIGYNNMEGILTEIFRQSAIKQGQPDTVFNVDNFVHAHLDFKENDPRREIVKEKLNKFYYQGELEHSNIVLASDCDYIAPAVGVAKLHAKTSPEPVFLYNISLVGGLNYLKNFFNMKHLPGTCHADELGYLFNLNIIEDKFEKGETEILAVRRFVKLWTNFAKYGNPTPEGNDLNVTWKPIDEEEVYFLDIGNELTLQSNPIPERLKVWKEIFQLSSNTNYYLQ